MKRPLGPRLTAGVPWLESESAAGARTRAPRIVLSGPHEDGTSKKRCPRALTWEWFHVRIDPLAACPGGGSFRRNPARRGTE